MDGDCGGDHDNDDNGDGAKRGVPAWLLSRATLPLGTHPFRVDGSSFLNSIINFYCYSPCVIGGAFDTFDTLALFSTF